MWRESKLDRDILMPATANERWQPSVRQNPQEGGSTPWGWGKDAAHHHSHCWQPHIRPRWASESPGGLVKQGYWTPLWVADPVGLEWGLRMCISNRFWGLLMLLVQGHTLRTAGLYPSPGHDQGFPVIESFIKKRRWIPALWGRGVECI